VPDPKQNLINARATITARSRQALARFDLDLSGLTVQSVTVDGVAATVERRSRELVITPGHAIENDHDFTTVVDYTGGPLPRSTPSLPIAVGWIATGNGSFTLSQPEGASTWFPVNDHPSDKATYTFHVDVPDGVIAVANGDLVGQAPAGAGRVAWTYELEDPMASYLAQVVVGDFRVTAESGPDGVQIRNVLDSALADEAAPMFTRTAEMISYFSSLFGKFPFDIYGGLVVNERTLLSLETQTLSTFGSELVGDPEAETTVAHELAHQWFGDSVSVESWEDMWLNEGFATYAEWLWKEHTTGVPVAQTAQTTLDELRGDPRSEVPPGDPGAENLFGISVYRRGALTLQALRLTIGDDAFFTTLRNYISKFAFANVSTDDFISVAEEASGRNDLRPLFDAWLYQPALPRLPG
jgi:aminopeptidase N